MIAHSPSDFVYPGFSLEASRAVASSAPFPENFPPAWQFEDKVIKMYSPIEVETVPCPLLITYGAKDPIWGPQVDPRKLHERLKGSGAKSVHFDFSNSESPEQFAKVIEGQVQEHPRAIFVRFVDEGHSPSPGSPSEKLQSILTKFFLATYLQSNQ